MLPFLVKGRVMNADSSNDRLWNGRLRPIIGQMAGLAVGQALTRSGRKPAGHYVGCRLSVLGSSLISGGSKRPFSRQGGIRLAFRT